MKPAARPGSGDHLDDRCSSSWHLELRVRLGGLPAAAAAANIWGDMWYQKARASTAIEGNTLVLSIVDILYRFIVPSKAGLPRLVPLVSLATLRLCADSLRKAAVRGRLKAQRDENGRWLGSRAWVDEYMTSRSRRGRPPNRERMKRVSTEVAVLTDPEGLGLSERSMLSSGVVIDQRQASLRADDPGLAVN